jgi:RNA polymerase sigma-70 factor (ECF subfamily)
MADPPSTRPSLLLRVRDERDAEAWRQFVELYGPMVYEFGRRRGLQDADAADLTQIVLSGLGEQLRRETYDRSAGPFRAWLFGLVRNQCRKLLAKRGRFPAGTGDTGIHEALAQHAAPESDEETHWQQEYEQRLFLWSAERVRLSVTESSWQAFWQTAVEGTSAKETAQRLGMAVGAVYTAKSRVLERIRREIEELENEGGGEPP